MKAISFFWQEFAMENMANYASYYGGLSSGGMAAHSLPLHAPSSTPSSLHQIHHNHHMMQSLHHHHLQQQQYPQSPDSEEQSPQEQQSILSQQQPPPQQPTHHHSQHLHNTSSSSSSSSSSLHNPYVHHPHHPEAMTPGPSPTDGAPGSTSSENGRPHTITEHLVPGHHNSNGQAMTGHSIHHLVPGAHEVRFQKILILSRYSYLHSALLKSLLFPNSMGHSLE